VVKPVLVGSITEKTPPTETTGTPIEKPESETCSVPDMLAGRFMSPLPPTSNGPDPVTLLLLNVKWNDEVPSSTPLVFSRRLVALIDGAPQPLSIHSDAVATTAMRRQAAMTCPPLGVDVAGEYRSADTLPRVTHQDTAALPQIEAAQFFGVDIRVGTVVSCETFPEARLPAYRMVIDFGPLGTRRSSGRLTDHYRPEELTGSTVVAVVNLPPRQIGPVRSEVLVLGVYQEHSDRVVLLRPDRACAPGDRVG
jgi:tRNA-binding protein